MIELEPVTCSFVVKARSAEEAGVHPDVPSLGTHETGSGWAWGCDKVTIQPLEPGVYDVDCWIRLHIVAGCNDAGSAVARQQMLERLRTRYTSGTF